MAAKTDKTVYSDTAVDTFPLSKMEYDDYHAKMTSVLSRKK